MTTNKIDYFSGTPADLASQVVEGGTAIALSKVSKHGHKIAQAYLDATWSGVGSDPNFACEYPIIQEWITRNGTITLGNMQIPFGVTLTTPMPLICATSPERLKDV